MNEDCARCSGTGRYKGYVCYDCKGAGKIAPGWNGTYRGLVCVKDYVRNDYTYFRAGDRCFTRPAKPALITGEARERIVNKRTKDALELRMTTINEYFREA